MKLIIKLTLLLILSTSISANAAHIKIVADTWCPYTCDPESNNQGFVVDIIKAIYQSKKTHVSYKYLPWSRAIKSVETGESDILMGTSPQEFPEGIFPEEEIGIYYNYFFTRQDDQWNFDDLESLKTKILGGVQDYNYLGLMPYVKRYRKTEKVQLLKGSNVVERNFNRLLKKHIDVYVEDLNVAMYTAYKMKIRDKIKVGGKEGSGVKLYVAFSPKNPEAKNLSKRFSLGLKKLRSTGKLKIILEKYGLNDWKKK